MQRYARLSVRETARAYHCSATTVMRKRKLEPGYQPDENGMVRVVTVLGRDGKLRPSRRLDTDIRDADFVRRRLSGQTFRQISAETGWSVGTIHRVIGGDIEPEVT